VGYKSFREYGPRGKLQNGDLKEKRKIKVGYP